MSLCERIAEALDAEGVDSAWDGDTLWVPISADVTSRFVPRSGAAEFYISATLDETLAACDVDDEFGAAAAPLPEGYTGEHSSRLPSQDIEREALVAVVFTAENAVRLVMQQIATDQALSYLEELIGAGFYPDDTSPYIVHKELTEHSTLTVLVREPDIDLWDEDVPELLMRVSMTTLRDLGEAEDAADPEVLDLGVYGNPDDVWDVVDMANVSARRWESMLTPVEFVE